MTMESQWAITFEIEGRMFEYTEIMECGLLLEEQRIKHAARFFFNSAAKYSQLMWKQFM